MNELGVLTRILYSLHVSQSRPFWPLSTFTVEFNSALFSAATGSFNAEFGISHDVGTLGVSLDVTGSATGPIFWAPYSEFKRAAGFPSSLACWDSRCSRYVWPPGRTCRRSSSAVSGAASSVRPHDHRGRRFRGYVRQRLPGGSHDGVFHQRPDGPHGGAVGWRLHRRIFPGLEVGPAGLQASWGLSAYSWISSSSSRPMLPAILTRKRPCESGGDRNWSFIPNRRRWRRLRFRSPMQVGARIRGRQKLLAADDMPGGGIHLDIPMDRRDRGQEGVRSVLPRP